MQTSTDAVPARSELPTEPAAVVAALTGAGFAWVGGRTSVYERFARGCSASPGACSSILVPLRPDDPEYPELMGAVLKELANLAELGRMAQEALDRISDALQRARELHG